MLREILQTVLKYKVYEDQTFVLEFDEIDVDFKIDRDSNKILDLIRVARDYNTKYFKDMPFKLLLFIRDDIKEYINSSDKTKLFNSYEYTINWYEASYLKGDESQMQLRKFINKRIANNYLNLNLSYNTQDPWKTLFSDEDYNNKTVFQHILDYTFYRPRDLVNLLSPLCELKCEHPLKKTSVNLLINKLAIKTMGDIVDELDILFDALYIESIKKVLKEISSSNPPVSYQKLLEIFANNEVKDEHIDLLIDYDLIIVSENAKYKYKYREQKIESELSECQFSIHKGLYVYFHKLK